MTMPHLMNCGHSDNSHCLDCVKETGERHAAEIIHLNTEIERLRAELVEANKTCEEIDADNVRLRTLYNAAWRECEAWRLAADNYTGDVRVVYGSAGHIATIRNARITHDAARKEEHGEARSKQDGCTQPV